jgi:Amt family ammonium transporter
LKNEKLMIQSMHCLSTEPLVWGTLSTGFFATPELATVGKPGLFYGGGFEQLGVQALGVVACGAFAFIVSYAVLAIMKASMNGLRVSEEEEIMGLDMSEHGTYGYPELLHTETAGSTAANSKQLPVEKRPLNA